MLTPSIENRLKLIPKHAFYHKKCQLLIMHYPMAIPLSIYFVSLVGNEGISAHFKVCPTKNTFPSLVLPPYIFLFQYEACVKLIKKIQFQISRENSYASLSSCVSPSHFIPCIYVRMAIKPGRLKL